MTRLFFNHFLVILVFAPVFGFLSSIAEATTAPYLAYGHIFTRTGSPDFSLIEEHSNSSLGTLNFSAGGSWFCTTPNCGVAITAGASSAWGDIDLDPAAGVLGGRAGSFAYDAYAGYAITYGYISQVVLVGSDGSLAPGATVDINLNMALQGVIDSDSFNAQAAGLVTANTYDPDRMYPDDVGNPVDYMPRSYFEDLFFSPGILDSMLGYVQHIDDKSGSPINFNGSDSFQAQVGDLLHIESMIYLTNDRGLSAGDINSSWTDFGNTMTSNVFALTPGANIEVVPIPPAFLLLISCVALLLPRSRKTRYPFTQ